MNRVVPNPVMPGNDNLGALLSAFFKAEMPKDWSAPVPSPRQPQADILPMPAANTPRRRRFSMLSRLALVASVALLLLTAWMMPDGHLPTSSPAIRHGEPAAKKGGLPLTQPDSKSLFPDAKIPDPLKPDFKMPDFEESPHMP